MISAPLPATEEARLEALRRYALLDTPPEEALDELARLASFICGTPVALVSLVDANRQWFKARHGLDATETPRELAFCAHAILHDDLMIIPDATRDPRFADNPLVQGDMHVRFYAGAPLVTHDGHALGSLCVIDQRPRELSPEQQDALRTLRRQVVAHFELRLTVSETARMYLDLRQTKEGLQAAHDQLSAAHEKLQQLGELKDQFMRIASHDLKNPLTVILGSSRTIEALVQPGATLTPQMHQMISAISRHARTMQRIVEDFLDFQALEDGHLELRRQGVDLAALVRDVLEVQRDYGLSKQMQVRMEGAEVLPHPACDRDRLAQVLHNLVGNAIKFSAPGGTVVVALRDSGEACEIDVRDEGPGLRPHDFEKLFTRYARLSNKPTGGEKSSGLGLAICKQLVELHGGQIGARNNAPAPGATFWLKLPTNRSTQES